MKNETKMENEGLKYLDDLRDRLLKIALHLLECSRNKTPIPDEIKQKFRNIYDDIQKIPEVPGTDAYPDYTIFISAAYRELFVGMIAQDNNLPTEFEPIVTDVWSEFMTPVGDKLYVFANFFGISTLLILYALALRAGIQFDDSPKNLVLKLTELFFENIYKITHSEKQPPIQGETPNA